MQAVLLATGETNKLRPLTDTVPSPMVPVAGRPVMSYPLELLIRQNFKQIVVNIYSQAYSIEAFFGTGSRWAIELQYALQPQAWGSAGSLRWARHHLTETFVVLPADQLIDIDLLPILEQHEAKKSAATIVIHPGANPHFSGFNLNGERIISPDQGAWFETGVYIFDPVVLDQIPARTHYDIAADLIPNLPAAGMAVDSYKVYGYWNSLETFSDLQDAQNALLSSAQGILDGTPSIHYTSMSGRRVQQGIWIGRNSNIHPEAQLIPPVFIGENCSISRGAEVGPGAVLGNDIMIDEEATVAHSTILDGTYVGQLVNVDHRVVNKALMIDINSGNSVYITDEHLLSKTYQDIDESSLSRTFDVVAASFILLFTLPFSLPTVLLLLVTNGQVFTSTPYVHRVPGEPGESRPRKNLNYNLYQFQTRNKKGQRSWIGKWLEQSDLHRLPHLWNVLRGDLRIVGVKPLTEEENNKIQEEWQEKRYNALPGFTGLWYVQVGRGHDLNEIIVTDAYYAATRSWRWDFRLLFQTFAIWFRRLIK